MAFMFNQAGELAYEVRATGILSTQPIDEGCDVPWGTIVHPGVLATHHQHIFSLRVDPMIDGPKNRLVYDEAHALPRSADLNPHGTGYVSRETVVQKSGGYDIDYAANRVYKIQNADVRNPVNGKPVGYKIHAPPFQKLLADTDSFTYKRAEFADRSIYAVKYRDGELYAGGQYTNQSRGGTGVRSWAARDEDIVDEDIVLFVQFGINHVSFLSFAHRSDLHLHGNLLTPSDPAHRRLPRHAVRDHQGCTEAGQLLRQEPGPRRAAEHAGRQSERAGDRPERHQWSRHRHRRRCGVLHDEQRHSTGELMSGHVSWPRAVRVPQAGRSRLSVTHGARACGCRPREGA